MKTTTASLTIVIVTIAVIFCIIFAIHALIVFDAILGFMIFIPLLLMFYIALINTKNTYSSPKSAARTAAIIAAGCIALQYILIFTTGTLDNNFIIGESDSLLYHNIAKVMATRLELSELMLSLSKVQQFADEFGYLIPNPGMYWFLAIIYSIVGINAGPGTYLIINTICAMAIAYYATLIAGFYSKKGISIYSSALFSALIFLNGEISSDCALHLRKDIFLIALLTAGIYYGIIGRWIVFIILTFLAIQLRAIFLIVFAVPVFFSITKYIPGTNNPSPKKTIALLIFAIILLTVGYEKVLALSGFSQHDVTSGDSLYVSLGASAIFAENGLFQWLYVILYPFPPLSLGAYASLDAWNLLLIFGINCYLCFWVFITVIKMPKNDNKYSLLLSIWSVLFLFLLINLLNAAHTGLFGVVEARYKFAWWVFSGIIMIIYKNNNKPI